MINRAEAGLACLWMTVAVSALAMAQEKPPEPPPGAKSGTVSGAQTGAPSPAPAATDPVRALFVFNCASCHGENGDGQGATKLEKPARSFKDGGFSYGNTPETLLRTITIGIPGTPMPSFASALTEVQRKDLARYVITLGPPQTEVKPSDTILVVKDRALVVHGKLPPIVEGAPERPRGLLIGTPDGLTFEYRTDDVRLLGVRQGAFVDRTDWTGRGGSALAPLGKVVYACGEGNPGPSFLWIPKEGVPAVTLEAHRPSTFVKGAEASLLCELIPAKDARGFFARLFERLHAHVSGIGSGFERSIEIHCEKPDGTELGMIQWNVSEGAGAKLIAAGDGWMVRSRRDGSLELQSTGELPDGSSMTFEAGSVVLRFQPENLKWIRITLVTLLLPAWNDEVRARWAKEIAR